MGYYTNYNLEMIIPEDDINKEALMNKIVSTIENKQNEINFGKIDQIDYFSIFCAYDVYSDKYMKWYDHDKDMLLFSKMFPRVLFQLSGEGDESDDIWITYYKNGKIAELRPEVVWPEFNEEMLR